MKELRMKQLLDAQQMMNIRSENFTTLEPNMCVHINPSHDVHIYLASLILRLAQRIRNGLFQRPAVVAGGFTSQPLSLRSSRRERASHWGHNLPHASMSRE